MRRRSPLHRIVLAAPLPRLVAIGPKAPTVGGSHHLAALIVEIHVIDLLDRAAVEFATIDQDLKHIARDSAEDIIAIDLGAGMPDFMRGLKMGKMAFQQKKSDIGSSGYWARVRL